MSKIGDSPCYGCTGKYLGCRSGCKHWTIFSIRQEVRRAERLREATLDNAFFDSARKRAKRHTNKWGGEG